VKTFLLGGIVPVSFSAMTADGLFAKADATLRLRPRLELLLLVLLLLCPATVAGAAALQQVISIALAPTATATFTPEPTALPTLTPTALPSETPTPEPTATPTLTPFPTATSCFNQCAALGWPSYLVREGDTLSSLAAAGNVSVARAAQVNCLVDPSRIQVGQRICLPVIPTTVPTCDGFRITSPTALPNGVATFYWDPPRGFTPTSYRVRVFNAENGSQLVSKDVAGTATNTQIDVSKGAIGGNFTFFWTVEALVNGAVTCSSRVDGLREAPTPIPASDVIVTSLTTSGGVWDATCSNFSIPLNYTVTNVGDRGSGDFISKLTYQIGTLSGSQCEPNSGRACPGANLAPGASASFSHTETLRATLLSTIPSISVVAIADTSGNSSLGQVCADAGFCNSPERDEGNNRSAVLNVPVPACTLPDLVVQNYDTGVNWSSDNCPDALNVTVYFNIRNQGSQTAAASTTQVSLTAYYDDQTATRTYSGTASMPSIAVGVSSSGSVTISVPYYVRVGGEFFISLDQGVNDPFTITADSGGVVVESNEDNNGLTASIIVSEYPGCLN
jgi:LysM repeat protein